MSLACSNYESYTIFVFFLSFRYQTDVSGICEIKYEAERGNDTMKIVKKKDIESCRERSMAHASLETMPFEKVSCSVLVITEVTKSQRKRRRQCRRQIFQKNFTFETWKVNVK